MIIHEFIDEKKPIMVLIHGVLTPWQIWLTQIEHFKNSYNIYAVALDAHTEEEASEFVSVQNEATGFIDYLNSEGVLCIDALCGISLGGKIAFEIWKSGKIEIKALVMDGAPLVSCPKFAVYIMKKNYINIVKKSKERDKKVIENFKKHFLPEKYLEHYLKIADSISYTSLENIVNSAFSGGNIKGVHSESRILFIHGTKANEILSNKSARLLKKHYPDTRVICFKGDVHCYKAIYQPEEWINAVEEFLKSE